MQRFNPIVWLLRLLAKIPPMPRIIWFYRKRTPFGRQQPKEWVRPATESEYQMDVHNEGFISIEHWEEDNLKDYPVIIQDLDDLEEYLMPVFWEFNQKARHYQGTYYFYQWIFIIGAFLTTIMGIFTTLFSGSNITLLGVQYGDVMLLGFNTNWSMVNMFSVITAIVSAITSYFTLLSNQGEPRKRWAGYRRLAEELRMLYFKFLARMEPYDKANRVEVLRRRIIEIREQEQSSA